MIQHSTGIGGLADASAGIDPRMVRGPSPVQGCAERDLACIDRLAAFRAHAAQTLYPPRDDIRWNARGNAMVRKALADALTARIKRDAGALR